MVPYRTSPSTTTTTATPPIHRKMETEQSNRFYGNDDDCKDDQRSIDQEGDDHHGGILDGDNNNRREEGGGSQVLVGGDEGNEGDDETDHQPGGRLEEQQQQQQQRLQQPIQQLFCFENLPSDLSDSQQQRPKINYPTTTKAADGTKVRTNNRKSKTLINKSNGGITISNSHISMKKERLPPTERGGEAVAAELAAVPSSSSLSSRRLLSEDLMRQLSGIDALSRRRPLRTEGRGCLCCSSSSRAADPPASAAVASSELYNLQALQHSLSHVSPLVSGPMLLHEETHDDDDGDGDGDDKEGNEEDEEDEYHQEEGQELIDDDDGSVGDTTNPEELDDNVIRSQTQRINGNVPFFVVTKTAEQLLMDYMVACQFYKVAYNAGVLTCLRFALPCLRVSGPFHDDDMLALVEVLLKHANTSLRHVIRLDFTVASKEGRRTTTHPTKSMMGFTSHGAFALAKLLQTTKYVTQVWLPRHRIGPYGASALFLACSQNPTIKVLNLRRCRIGEKGALAFCELILGQKPQQQEDYDTEQYYSVPPQNRTRYSTSNYKTNSNGEHLSVPSDCGPFKAVSTRRVTAGLVDVDLSANLIGHHGTAAIENALEVLKEKERIDSREDNAGSNDGRSCDPSGLGPNAQANDVMFVNLEGNLVFPEILNGVTHGCGVLLSLVGGYALWKRVAIMSTWTHTISCTIYTFSLLALYVSSTLYHSFFTLVNTRYVFQVMDKCAIYILIAGSYTPYLQILMNDRPEYSYGLLAAIWLCAILGISVEAMYPTWKWKNTFSLFMYLSMGWCAVICLPEIKDRIELGCIKFLVLGGVGYTAGVPFFVRNNNLDHAIWHLFVLSGSIFHWLGCFLYVASHPLPLLASDNDSCLTS